jgi:hypothetical protein
VINPPLDGCSLEEDGAAEAYPAPSGTPCVAASATTVAQHITLRALELP